MAEKTEEAALLAKTEGAPDNGRVLVMTDGEETLGYVVVALEDDTLVFYGFSVSGQTDFSSAVMCLPLTVSSQRPYPVMLFSIGSSLF